MKSNNKHIVSVNDITRHQAENIIDNAIHFRNHFESIHSFLDVLKNKIVLNAFFENSTRTKNSFEIAASRLGATVVNFNSAGSSVAKGESLYDTLQTLDCMLPDIIVMRSSLSGACEYASKFVDASILNAGDGKHEHPSQALLDAMTLLDRFSVLDGIKIGITGDILHSRVARSNILLLQKLGAVVGVCGPGTLVPTVIKEWNVEMFTTVDDITDWCDVIMALRVQKERMDSGFIASAGEYNKFYGVKLFHVIRNPKLLVLHPGPVNYGVEIDFDVANCKQSLIRNQVANGVFVRMAMLVSLSGRDCLI